MAQVEARSPLADFFETVAYVGDVTPWREVPETEESDDEPAE